MASTNAQRGVVLRGAAHATRVIAAGTISANRALELSSGQIQHATAHSATFIGSSKDQVAIGQYGEVLWGRVALTAEVAITAGQSLKCGAAGKVMPLIDESIAGDTIKTTGNGLAFGNQPANDAVEVLSSSAADTTQSVTVIGTTTGTDTVVVETIALNGTTPVASTKTDWGVILAVKLDASCAGTVTVQEASADADITTLLTTVLSKGVETVTTTSAYNAIPTIQASDTSVKAIGLQGTNSAGTVIYDSQVLVDTTPTAVNSSFRTVTEVYTGDLESNRTTTVKVVAAAEAAGRKIGRAIEDAAADATFFAIVTP